jgi:hypothetical protein
MKLTIRIGADEYQIDGAGFEHHGTVDFSAGGQGKIGPQGAEQLLKILGSNYMQRSFSIASDAVRLLDCRVHRNDERGVVFQYLVKG